MRISDWSSDVCSSDLRDADDLGRVDDTGLDEVFIDVGRGVEAEARVLLVEQLARDDTAVEARVLADLADRSLPRTTDDVDPADQGFVEARQDLERLRSVQQRRTAPGGQDFSDPGPDGSAETGENPIR